MNEPSNIQGARGYTVPAKYRERLLAIVRQNGERATLEDLGLARHTLERCLAGLSVHRATVQVVIGRLDDIV